MSSTPSTPTLTVFATDKLQPIPANHAGCEINFDAHGRGEVGVWWATHYRLWFVVHTPELPMQSLLVLHLLFSFEFALDK